MGKNIEEIFFTKKEIVIKLLKLTKTFFASKDLKT